MADAARDLHKRVRVAHKRKGTTVAAKAAGTGAGPTAGTGAGEPVQLTRYERTQVIGIRAEQLARGAQPFVEVAPPSLDGDDDGEQVSMYSIAERELAAGRLPFIIVRHMPDGSTQHIRLCDAVV